MRKLSVLELVSLWLLAIAVLCCLAGGLLAWKIRRDRALLQPKLASALDSGDLAEAKRLVERGASVHTVDSFGHPALVDAIDGRDLGFARELLKRGASPGAASPDGSTPLHEACLLRSRPIVELLLTRDVDVNAIDQRGITPLMWAVIMRDAQLCRTLLDRGADPRSIRSNQGWNAIDLAAKVHDRAIHRLLISR